MRYSLHVCLREASTICFPSETPIYGISRDGSKNFNLRTCEHMILGQLTIGARQTKNAPLVRTFGEHPKSVPRTSQGHPENIPRTSYEHFENSLRTT